MEKEPEVVNIDEERIDRLLHMIHEADPSGDKSDSEELLILEGIKRLIFYQLFTHFLWLTHRAVHSNESTH